MNYKYWMMLDWTGEPAKSNPEHKGWHKIESYSLDIANKGGAKSGGTVGIRISLDSPAMILAPVLDLKLKTGDPYSSVAIDMMTPGKWVRNEFRNVNVASALPRGGMYIYNFEFESILVRQIAIPRSRAAAL